MIDYNTIPPLVMGAMERYVNKGYPPGDFVTAVICNDLIEACGRADADSMAALHSIVGWFYNVPPSLCWRTPERMKEWMQRGGIEGIKKEQASCDG